VRRVRNPLFRGGSRLWKLDVVAGDRRLPAQSAAARIP
jgi:hypothetical protein